MTHNNHHQQNDTELAHCQERIARLERWLRAETLVSTISTMFINLPPHNIEQGIPKTLQIIAEFLGADRAHLVLFSEDGDSLTGLYEWSAPTVSPRWTAFAAASEKQPLNITLLETVLPHQMDLMYQVEPFFVKTLTDLVDDAPQDWETLHRHQVASMLAVPLTSAEWLVGFLGFECVAESSPAATEEEADFASSEGWLDESVRLVRLLGEILASALERRRTQRVLRETNLELEQRISEQTEALTMVVTELKADIAKRQQVERDLRKSQANLRAIFDGMLHSVILIDHDYRVLAVNEIAQRHTRALFNTTTNVGDSLLKFVPSEELPTFQQHISRNFKGEISYLERFYTTTTGEQMVLEITHLPINLDGEVMGVCILSLDVAEKKRTERQLQENEALLRHIITSLTDCIYVIETSPDLPPRSRYISPQMVEISGYTPTHLQADWNFWSKQVIHPEDYQSAQTHFERLCAGYAGELEYRIVRADGQVAWVRDSARVVSEDGKRTIYGVISDVTEREALLTAEKEQRLIAEILSEVTLALTSQRESQVVLDEVLRQASRLVHYDTANLAFIEGQLVRVIRLQGEKDEVQLPQYDKPLRNLSHFPTDVEAVQSKQPIILADTHADDRWLVTEGTEWIRSYMVIPLHWQGEVLGLLRLNGAQPQQFSSMSVTRLQPLAYAAAVALQNAQLYDQLQQELRERTRIEAALRRSEAFTRTILDSLTAQIAVLDCEGNIIHVNKSWAAFATENDGDSVVRSGVGLNYLAVCGQAEGEWSAEALPVARGLQAVLRQEQSEFSLEYPCHAPSEQRWFQLHAVPLVNHADGGLVVSHINITRLKQTEDALRRSRQRYRQRALELHALYTLSLELNSQRPMADLLTLICEQIVDLVKAQGGCLAIYDSTQQQFSVLVATGAMSPFRQMVVSFDAGLFGRVLARKVPQTLTNYAQWSSRLIDQFEKPLGAVLAVPLLKQQTVIGVLEVARYSDESPFSKQDVRVAELFAAQATIALENTRLYEKERAQAKQLQESQAQLVRVEKMAALGRLTAAIAHEINNPLQAVHSCLAVLRDELAVELAAVELDELVNLADEEIHRIAALIQRMRKFYRPTEIDKTEPNGASKPVKREATTQERSAELAVADSFYQLDVKAWQTVNLHKILLDVAMLLTQRLKQSDILFNSELDHHLPDIQGHPDHLKQVFLNLALNAIDAMDETQGGHLTFRTRLETSVPETLIPMLNGGGSTMPLLDEAEATETTVKIEIVDTGPGISPDIESNLFEPFFTTKSHGTGLGLFTCYRIVEAHNGYIEMDSTVGQGTTFVITLPVKGES